MPERHVIERGKNRSVHIVEPAHVLLGLAAFRARHELVGNQHVPAARRKMHLRDGRLHGRRVILHRVALVVAREAGPDIHRPHERQHPHVDLAFAVGERDRCEFPVVDLGHVHAALFHEPPAESDTLRRIVVPAQYERAHFSRGKFHQKIVKHRDRLGTRHRLVVNVTRNQHRIGLLAVHSLQNARQYTPLLIEH